MSASTLTMTKRLRRKAQEQNRMRLMKVLQDEELSVVDRQYYTMQLRALEGLAQQAAE